MATFAFAMTSLCLGLLAFAASGKFLPAEKLAMTLELGPRFALLTLLVMSPLVLLASALQTLIAAFAKSYREAQTYLSVLMLLPMLPTLFLGLVPLKAKLWMMVIPLLGQHMLITKLVRGETVSINEVALCIVCGYAIAFVICSLAARVYSSERLAISA